MKMKRSDHWKQATPKAQVVVCIMAAQGDLLNVLDACAANPQVALKRALAFLAEAQTIMRHFGETWDDVNEVTDASG